MERADLKYQWWRVDEYSDWEPVRITKNSDGDEVCKFIGRKDWGFKNHVMGEWGEELKMPS